MAVRKGDFKLHLQETSPILYDLGNDPGEKVNITESYSQVVKELASLATSHIQKTEIKESIFDRLK